MIGETLNLKKDGKLWKEWRWWLGLFIQGNGFTWYPPIVKYPLFLVSNIVNLQLNGIHPIYWFVYYKYDTNQIYWAYPGLNFIWMILLWLRDMRFSFHRWCCNNGFLIVTEGGYYNTGKWQWKYWKSQRRLLRR